MCSIAGEVSYICNIKNRENEFLKMQKVLSPRGPDEKGEYIREKVALLHTRLSIIDIENGKQPMYFKKDESELVIVYNGMLYNTEEIRSELIKKGYSFKGHSDTEVVLKAYAEYGNDCVKLFNGIFAFAVWNDKKEELFFARDRLGIKPFFYSYVNGNFIFASEIKALLQNGEISPEIDFNSIMEIMFIGPGRTPGYGVFNNIKEVLPACCGTFSKDGLKIYKYWFLEAKEHTNSFSQTVEKVRFLVTDSIKRQLVSDVPIGTMLSGGLDSSIVSSVADKYFTEQGKKLETFTVTYKDNDKYFKKSKFQPNSDTQFVGKMNDYLNAENHLIVIDNEQLVSALYEAVEARDLPGMADIDSSMLLFCKEIKKHCKAVLSGECSDEIFGGYPWYRDKTIRETDGFPWAQSTAYRKTFLHDDLLKNCNADDYVYSRYQKTVNEAYTLPFENDEDKRTKEMMKLNLDWFMQTLVDRTDRMSMYGALEVRVPFCDYRIVEYLYNVPWKYKDYKGYEKGLLREAVKDILPDEILWRKKSPYPKTHNPRYTQLVKSELSNLLADNNAPIFEFVKKESLEKLMGENNAQPFYGQLMTTPQTMAYFLQINFWLQKYNIKIKI